MAKLNANAQKWVDALRSGEYKQGKWRLGNQAKGFCCLGVLAAISGFPFEENAGGLNQFPAIRAWAGLDDGIGDYETGALVTDNDEGKTFKEIADIIEEHAEELGVIA